jgi:hypothetical protein
MKCIFCGYPVIDWPLVNINVCASCKSWVLHHFYVENGYRTVNQISDEEINSLIIRKMEVFSKRFLQGLPIGFCECKTNNGTKCEKYAMGYLNGKMICGYHQSWHNKGFPAQFVGGSTKRETILKNLALDFLWRQNGFDRNRNNGTENANRRFEERCCYI